jgi:hypothetical protein
MTTRASWTSVCAFLAFCTACSSGAGPRTEEQFCQQYANIECSKIAPFCSFSPANCEPARVNACRVMASQLKGVGHQYNPANTDACLNKLSEAYSTNLITPVMLKAVSDTCARVFEGTAKMTEACMLDYDCVSGFICDKGHCGVQKTVASGGLCANPGEQCPKGEYCSSATGVFVCTKRAALGTACSPSVPCDESLRCVSSVCVARLDTQGMCTQDDDCMSDYCNLYGSTRTCGPGLAFAFESASCKAYMGTPDGGLPGRGNNDVVDAGPDGAAVDAAAAPDAPAADTGASSADGATD